MASFSSSADPIDRLLRSGWLISAIAAEPGRKVTGSYRGLTMAVLSPTREEALHLLCERAEAEGFLSAD